MSKWDLSPEFTLERLADMWLTDIEPTVDPDTLGLYRLYMRKHLCPYFETPHQIQTATIASYGRARLRVVKRSTLQKERSTLRGFLAWCEEQGYLVEGPEFAKLPKRALGTAYAKRRRGEATDLSPEECRAIIERLPQWTRPRGETESFPVRARFVVAYETALRPATLDALSCPEHYSKGSDTLRVSDEIDKARFGRTLPLTDAARAALDSVARQGVLFGTHNYRRYLREAAQKVLPEHKARTFTAYDLRHARLTELAEGGNLTGVAYLAGHKLVTTTSIYVRPGLRAAERALAPFDGSLVSQAGRLTSDEIVSDSKSGAKKRDRTSTSFRTLEPEESTQCASNEHMSDLLSESVSILAAASAGKTVDEDRVRALALAAIALTPIGRLALAVLEGGEFAPRSVIELARALAESCADATRRHKSGG